MFQVIRYRSIFIGARVMMNRYAVKVNKPKNKSQCALNYDIKMVKNEKYTLKQKKEKLHGSNVLN